MMMRLTWATAILSVGVLTVTVMFSEPARSDDKSAAVYKQKCASCHGADGKGETPAGKAMKVRSFASPETAKMSDDELAGIIEKGQGKMPKYGATMKADEIKAMVAYIRTLAK
jgi:cytochrome c6